MRREGAEVVRIPARGSQTAVHIYGSGGAPSILAVHGFRGTHYGLEPLATALASRGYQVLVPDLPGAGNSSPLASRHDAAGYGLWLAELGLQLPRARIMLGHSFGSVIVGSAIAQGAEHDGTVLINPILAPPLEGPRRIATAAARAYYALATRLPSAFGQRLLASRIIAGISGRLMTSTTDARLRRWIRDEHLRQAGAFASREVVLESFAASIATTVMDFAHSISKPALLVGGGRDPLAGSPVHTVDATGIQGSTFHAFPERGHLLPYEETHEVARLIAEWDRTVVAQSLVSSQSLVPEE